MNIIDLKSVDSSNNYIKLHPELWHENYTVVLAREQTGGRGRYGRTWFSTPGKDLTFSLVYNTRFGADALPVITLVSGLALYNALKQYVPAGLSLKWPNDVCYEDYKLGGILCEWIQGGENNCIVIGAGINVNSEHFPGGFDRTPTSLKLITGREAEIEGLLYVILENLKNELEKNSFPLGQETVDRWLSVTSSIGSHVIYFSDNKKKQGIIRSLNPDGSIYIENDEGEILPSYHGEVLSQLKS